MYHKEEDRDEIVIGCDPNAEKEKQDLIRFIEEQKLGEVTDFGSEDPIYANVAIRVGEAVAAKNLTVEFCCAEQESAYLSQQISKGSLCSASY